MDLSEPELAKTIYLIVQNILKKGIFSSNPENISIERVSNRDVFPCARSYGPEGLDLSQLELAAKEGHFWFSGSVKAIKIIVDKGSVQGDLRLETDKMLFITSLNTLNYPDFETVARKLRKSAQRLGLKLYFQQHPEARYNIILTVEAERALSVKNVNDFIEQLHALKRSGERG